MEGTRHAQRQDRPSRRADSLVGQCQDGQWDSGNERAQLGAARKPWRPVAGSVQGSEGKGGGKGVGAQVSTDTCGQVEEGGGGGGPGKRPLPSEWQVCHSVPR